MLERKVVAVTGAGSGIAEQSHFLQHNTVSAELSLPISTPTRLQKPRAGSAASESRSKLSSRMLPSPALAI